MPRMDKNALRSEAVVVGDEKFVQLVNPKKKRGKKEELKKKKKNLCSVGNWK